MADADAKTVEALIVALPESAGSAIYGLVDISASTGTLWRELVGDEPGRPLIRPRIVSTSRDPFRCGNAIPVTPDLTINEKSNADIIVIPELWLAHDDDLKHRYSELKEWLRRRYHAGNAIYTHFREPHAVSAVVAECGIAERSLKRRFTTATGSTVIGYIQNLRIEEAKRLLETGDASSDDIAAAVGYENPAFFRKLFKRCTGLTAGHYRRIFRPISHAGHVHVVAMPDSTTY